MRICLFLIFLSFYSVCTFAETQVPLKVASFPFKPLIFQSDQGQIQGLNADILNWIAHENGWNITYIHESWNNGLEATRHGQLDLMTSVMYTTDRDKYLDYTKESVFVVWGEVYALPQTHISDLFSLDGKTVAIMEGDLSGLNFQNLAKKFDIHCNYLIVPSHNHVFEAVEHKRAFAGVAPNAFGLINAPDFGLARTSILFSPNPLYFAVPKGTNQYVLNAIDHQLKIWKADKGSFYYQSLNRWFTPLDTTGGNFPRWLGYVLAICVGLLLLFAAWSRILSGAVKKKTKELSDTLNALSLEKEKYKLLADHTYDWEYWLGPDNNYRYISPSCQRISGYAPEEFISGPNLMIDIVLPSHRTCAKAHFSENINEAPECSFELPIKTKNNEVKWIEHHCLPVYDSQGIFHGRRGNNRDITQAKLAQNEQERLLEAITQSKEVVVITDRNGIIKYVNPAFSTVTGYSTEEAIGQNPRILQSGKHDITFYKNMWDCLVGGQTWTGLLTNKRKDGTLYIEEATISPVFNLVGDIEHFVAVKRDITEKIKADRIQSELEEQVAQKSKMEALGLLSGGLAHNFNNSLSIILGNLELLTIKEKGVLGKIELVENAKIGVTRARELIHQIMLYSRTGSKVLENVDLKNVLDETYKLLKSTLPTTVCIDYQVNADTQDLVTHASTTRIQEALFNLCNNAVHAMEEKGRLTISLAKATLQKTDIPAQFLTAHPGKFGKITVSDTGHGISNENLNKIFEPFYTTKDPQSGTGMGLSSVYGYLVDIGGTIVVQSTLSVGTTFHLYFPLFETEEMTQVEITVNDLPGTESILLVDDDELLVKVNEKLLIFNGYQVTAMTDSQKALNLFKEYPDQFDLVITDQTMPRMTGEEIIQRMLEIRPNLKTIIYTGYHDKIDTALASKLKVKKILLKPLPYIELLKSIRYVFDQ